MIFRRKETPGQRLRSALATLTDLGEAMKRRLQLDFLDLDDWVYRTRDEAESAARSVQRILRLLGHDEDIDKAAAIAKSKAHHPAYRLLYGPPIV